MMHKKPLGHTDILVSTICLGTMTWGEQNTEAEAHDQLDLAMDLGVNFIDTAEMYPVPPRPQTQGLTESFLGSWLARRKGRENLVIASKVTGPSAGFGHIRGGPRLDRVQIRQALDDSLKRLNTDYIDLYQVHWPERSCNYFGQLGYRHTEEPDAIPILETLRALGELVQAGKIRAIGISNETPWGMMEYLRLADREHLPRVVSIQNPYNLLNRSFEVGLAEMAIRERVGLLAYSPLGFGVLSGKYLDHAPANARLSLFDRFSRYSGEHATAATRAYVELARRHGLKPAQMALAFVNSRPFLTSNIIGATTMEQLRENIESAHLQLSDDLLGELDVLHERFTYPCP